MCCGSNRAAARAIAMAQSSGRVAPAAPLGVASVIMFEHLGDGPTNIRGAVSGRLYRFARKGDRLEVDARDRPGLLGMAMLRWVR